MENDKTKGKYFEIKRRKLFIQLEDSKMNFDSGINNFNSNNSNNDNLRTYNNYSLQLNLKSNNNDNNKEYYLTEKNENFYLSDDKRIISDKNSKMKNNNIDEIITKEYNKTDIKRFFENINKTEKKDDIITNMSSIEKRNSETKNDSSKNQNILETNNINNKENIINNIKTNYLIHEPNILKSIKIQEMKKKFINKLNDKNENSKNVELIQPNLFRQKKIKNEENKNNDIKNNIYHYLTNLEDGKNEKDFKNDFNNMRLDILKRKIKEKNKFENINEEGRTTTRLTYVGLKRYQNFSISNLSQMQKGIDTFFMVNENKNKMNNFKKDSNTKETDINKNPKINDILKKNKGIEDIFTKIVQPNINNKTKKHYNNILSQLNKTIEKLPKNEGNFEIDKINFNRTFRQYSNLKTNEINYCSPIKKQRKDKITLFEKVNLTKGNDFNDKNKKLIFESKVYDMNKTINKLLKITPELSKEKRTTFPANNFRKTKSFSKAYNTRGNRNKIIII